MDPGRTIRFLLFRTKESEKLFNVWEYRSKNKLRDKRITYTDFVDLDKSVDSINLMSILKISEVKSR